MTVDNLTGKWLNMSKQGCYIPQFIKSLPDNFTIEYDLLFIAPASSTGPNTAKAGLQFINSTGNKPVFDYGPDRTYFELDPYMSKVNIASYTKTGEKNLSNEFEAKGVERNKSFTYHVAVWRQKTRLMVYLNETKIVGVPSLSAADIKYNAVRFATPLNNDGMEFLPIKNIVHIESSTNYSKVFLKEGKQILVITLLKDFEDMLLPYLFFRIHNSHLIKLNYIQKYIRGEGGQVIMQNGDAIDVSRRKKDEFLKLITT